MTAATAPWIAAIIEAARPALTEDRDLAIVLLPPPSWRPVVHGRYKLAPTKPGQRQSARLRPYFATIGKLTSNEFNGYAVVRRGDRIIVYLAADTVLASDGIAP